jgi:hypothetical protein
MAPGATAIVGTGEGTAVVSERVGVTPIKAGGSIWKGVGVSDGVGVAVGVAVGVWVGLLVGVLEGVGDGRGVEVAVGSGVGVGVLLRATLDNLGVGVGAERVRVGSSGFRVEITTSEAMYPVISIKTPKIAKTTRNRVAMMRLLWVMRHLHCVVDRLAVFRGILLLYGYSATWAFAQNVIRYYNADTCLLAMMGGGFHDECEKHWTAKVS